MRKSLPVLLLILLISPFPAVSQCISSYPSTEDFEFSSGGWSPSGTNSDWSWGAPVKSSISGAGSGNKCWISGGLASSSYTGSQKSWIESPCYDLSPLQNPYLTFLIYWDTERQYDGGNLQYELNNNGIWVNAGSTGTLQDCLNKNWFNTGSITNLSGLASPTQGWSGTTQATSGSCLGGGGSGGWKEAGLCLGFLSGQTSVKFRFTFSSGSTCNAFDGIAIDRFTISEAPVPQPAVAATCTGGYSVSFAGTSTLCPQSLRWNFGDTSTSGDTANGTAVQYTYSSPGNYTVTLVAAHTCTADGSTSYIVRFPGLQSATTAETCAGSLDGTAQAVVTGVTGPVITWGTDPVTIAATVNGLSAGTYSLSVTSADGCQLDTMVEIGYGPGAFPSVSLGGDRFVCPGDQVLLVPGIWTDYLWQDGSSDSIFLATEDGIYSVIVSNASGCTATDEMKVVYSCGDDVWIPSAFTPGSDGLNDFFQARATVFEEAMLRIFNRWGQPVYQGDGIAGWDGNNNGEPAPEGIYYYRFRYRLPGDKYRERAGWLTLLR